MADFTAYAMNHLQALPCVSATLAATGLLTAYVVLVSLADLVIAPSAVVSKSSTTTT